MSEAKEGKGKKLSISFDLMDMVNIFRKTLQERSFFAAVDSKIDEKVNAAIERGEIDEDFGRKHAKEIKDGVRNSVDKIYEKIDNGIERSLKTLHIATVEDVKKIEERLDSVLKKLSEIENAKVTKSAAKRKNSAKSTTRKSTSKSTSKRKTGSTRQKN